MVLKFNTFGDDTVFHVKIIRLKNKKRVRRNTADHVRSALHILQRGIIGNNSLNKEIFPLGRLDKDSHGLMLLTNDGRVTDRLLNPEYAHDKEYIVSVKEKLRSNFKEKTEAGVDIEGYLTKKCKIEILNDFKFKITLTEGKKHQIRRMCVALHNEVQDLKRTRIMNIELGKLPAGSHRAIGGEELKTFLKRLGL